MSKKTLVDEIAKISLSEKQKEIVNRHFNNIKSILGEIGYFNFQKQGSFGRGTVIKGQESDGFDLDIAVVVETDDVSKADQLNWKIFHILNGKYYGLNQSVNFKDKAIKIVVDSKFSIDITQIYKKNEIELVYNSQLKNFELSYALKFRDKFKEKNNDSNNALRDVARIYKHVRDAVSDVELKSLALEMILFNAFLKNSSYEQTMIDTLKNFQIILDSVTICDC